MVTIEQQPFDAGTLVGDEALFYLYATGNGTLTYQWVRNSVVQVGETDREYTYTVALENNGDTVYCLITDDDETISTTTVTVVVYDFLEITSQPVDTSGQVGQLLSFSVAAAGKPPITYQWYKNDIALESSASTHNFVVGSLQDDGNEYYCRVENGDSEIDSDVATFSISLGISVQPVSITRVQGQDAAFSVTAVGSGVFTYQWYKNSVLIPGAESDSYNFTCVLGDNGNEYFCIVGNETGNTTTDTAILTVIASYEITKNDYYVRLQPAKSEELVNQVTITTQPLSAVASETIYTTEELYLSPTQEITINALYDKKPVVSASSAIIYGAGGVVDIEDEEYYAIGANIRIKNNDAIDGSFKLQITGAPLVVEGEQIVTQKDADSILANGLKKYEYKKNHLIQTTDMANKIAAVLLATYKLYRKDVSVDWRGDPTIELADFVEAPIYQRGTDDVRGLYQITKSKLEYNGTIRETTDGRIMPSLQIVTQPQDVISLNGSDVSFSITAVGRGTLSYQWYRDSVLQTGENNSVFNMVVGSVTVDTPDIIVYCSVSDFYSTINSNNATCFLLAS